MAWYKDLDSKNPEDRRTAEGLLRLKEALDLAVPPRTPSTMLLATWNIREFESGKYGPRSAEPIYYMAEVIDRFDVVAVQEVRDDLSSFNRLMDLLGSSWSFLLTDVTEGKGGNRERMAFLYNSERVRFAGLAGEVVLPPQGGAARVQLVRSPFIVGLKSGWLKFAVCTAHILYGKAVAEHPPRVAEIKDLVTFLVKRATSAYPDARNTILLGDFNIFDTTGNAFDALQAQGFAIPDSILEQTSNVAKNKHYDQIAILGRDLDEPTVRGLNAGAFHMFEYVYREDDEGEYESPMGEAYNKTKTGKARTKAEKTRYYRDWRTFQVSDHMPLWVEIPTDYSKEYLEQKARRPAGRTRKAARDRPSATRTPAAAALLNTGPLSPPPRAD